MTLFSSTDEFFKLDAIDKKVLFWMMDQNPQALLAWTQELARQQKYRNVIDAGKLYAEVQSELNVVLAKPVQYTA